MFLKVNNLAMLQTDSLNIAGMINSVFKKHCAMSPFGDYYYVGLSYVGP